MRDTLLPRPFGQSKEESRVDAERKIACSFCIPVEDGRRHRTGRFLQHKVTPFSLLTASFIITFRVRRSRGEMYIGHGRLCLLRVSVCLSVPRRIPTLLHGPRCKLGEW